MVQIEKMTDFVLREASSSGAGDAVDVARRVAIVADHGDKTVSRLGAALSKALTDAGAASPEQEKRAVQEAKTFLKQLVWVRPHPREIGSTLVSFGADAVYTTLTNFVAKVAKALETIAGKGIVSRVDSSLTVKATRKTTLDMLAAEPLTRDLLAASLGND